MRKLLETPIPHTKGYESYLRDVPLFVAAEGQSLQELNWGSLCRLSVEIPRSGAWRGNASSGIVLFLLLLAPAWLAAQTSDTEKPVPILTGNAGAFSFVTAGQNLIDTQINPVLLVPLGDRWLIEARAEFEGEFQRPPDGGPYGGPVDKHVDYAQVDYIASPYVTITAGRFLTPFGIFNERLYPVWIRALQPDPLILPINTAPSDGAMFRGGFPVNAKANLNYAVYVSATSIGIDSVDSERHVGGRMGVLLSRASPRSRRLLAAHPAG